MWSMNKEKKDKKTNIPEVILEATSGGGQKRKKRDWTEERWKEKHLMEGTKKKEKNKISQQSGTEKDVEAMSPAAGKLQRRKYLVKDYSWRRTTGSCLVFQSSKQHPEEPQISDTQTHAHKPASCRTSLVLVWTISRLFLLFQNSSEK